MPSTELTQSVVLQWYIAQVGTNITANSISAANDLTVVCILSPLPDPPAV